MEPSTEPNVDPLVGKSLSDRYRVLRKLGEGGMGAVYEAEHTLIKKRVAVKVLHPEYSQNAEVVTRFHREALAATGIGNEHIVEVTDMGRLDGGGMYMVLELLAGRDFAALIEAEGRLAIGRAVRIVRQMCDGLGAAHEKGIVHRDLKPENVFLITRHGDPEFVKILDFGISKMLTVEGEPEARAQTKTGMIIGTALYMPPEQARGLKEVDHRADIYALGVILYRALSGEYPFQAESYVDLVVKLCTEEPVPLRTHRPDLPPALLAIVERCLSKEASARYESCAQLSAALAPFAAMDEAPPRRAIDGPADTVDVAAATMQAPAIETTRAAEVVTPPLAREVPASDRGAEREKPTSRASSREPGDEPSAPRRSPIVPIAVALALVAIVGGGWAATRRPADEASPEPRVVAPTPSPTPPDPVPEPPPPPTAPDPVARPSAPRDEPPVAIEITTAPVTDAELFLDGAPISNPFHGALPHSTELHALEARAPGYRTFLRDISLAYPQQIEITLHRGRGVEDRRERPTASATPETQAQEAPTVTAPPSTTTGPAPTIAEPDPDPDPDPLIVVPPPPHALKRFTSHVP